MIGKLARRMAQAYTTYQTNPERGRIEAANILLQLTRELLDGPSPVPNGPIYHMVEDIRATYRAIFQL